MISPLSWELIEIHKLYKDRILPISGGMYEQPNVFLEAMTLIDHVMSQP